MHPADVTMSQAVPTPTRDQVRHDWFQATVRECQVFIGRALLIDDYREVRTSAHELIARLPGANNREEELLLRGVLIGVAAKWGQLMHRAVHERVDERCHFEHSAPLDCFWTDAHQPAKHVFTQWAEAFATALILAHPVSSTQEAAMAIRAEFSRPWSVAQLAALVGVTPARLRRAFLREHGCAVPEYHRRVRLLNALGRISESRVKIKTVVREVGYRSKKNFYRTFQRLTGFTPVRFRCLPRSARNEIIQAMKLSLVAHNTRSALPTVRPSAPSCSHAEAETGQRMESP